MINEFNPEKSHPLDLWNRDFVLRMDSSRRLVIDAEAKSTAEVR